MNDIYTKQNSEENILRLRAQGRAYDKAKNYNWSIIIGSTIIVVLLAVLGNIFKDCKCLEYFSIVYSAVVTVVTTLLEFSRASKKNFAARIQQLIDSELFGINWEKHWGKKPSLDEIQRIAEGEPKDRYINWYDEAINRVCKEAAITICFRININYDDKLRNGFMSICHKCFWVFFAVLLVACMTCDISLKTFLFYVVFPGLPIIILYVKTWHDYRTDTICLENLKQEVDNIQSQLKKGQSITNKSLSDIQTMILKHRENCFDIPSLYYKNHRTDNEMSCHEFANMLADELLVNQNLANK